MRIALLLIATAAIFISDVVGLVNGSIDIWWSRLIAVAFICLVVYMAAQIIGKC